MAKKKEDKTNVMRILERERIPYQSHFYPHDGTAVDGVTVAHTLGQDPARVFKTLVAKGSSGACHVFVIPVEKELDLKAAARAAGEKAVGLLPVRALLAATGYVRGGCSPIGMKKQYETVVDESCLLYSSIFFSGGKIGVQVQVESQALLQLIGAKTAILTRGGQANWEEPSIE